MKRDVRDEKGECQKSLSGLSFPSCLFTLGCFLPIRLGPEHSSWVSRHSKPQRLDHQALENRTAFSGGTPVATVEIDPRMERITALMDRAIRIPGTNLRVGLDPILGLVLPQIGDAIGALISGYLILESVRYGLPKGVIARMIFNLGLDYAMGAIPLIGDLTDFAWKANDKNLKLLKLHARGEGRSFWSDWGWAIILLALLGGLIAGLILLSVALLSRVSLW